MRLLDQKSHQGVRDCLRDLNRLYRAESALYVHDCEAEGFRWIVVDDALQSVYAWLRVGNAEDAPIAAICNFTPVPRDNYRIGLPFAGVWREIMNTDAEHYGGSGLGNWGAVRAEERPSHGFPASAALTLPPLATLYLRFEATENKLRTD